MFSGDKEEPVVNKKNWEEFRKTGLVLIINQILHIFGWALVFSVDENNHEDILNVYPARVKFRGFGGESMDKAYRKISQYMVDNAVELNKEAQEE